MPEEVKINDELKIIEVISFGDVSNEDILASVASVAKIFKETRISKVLVDTTEEKSFPSTFEVLSIASNMPRDMRFALFVRETQSTKRDVHFFETVALNRGFSFQTFTSKNEALKWLRS